MKSSQNGRWVLRVLFVFSRPDEGEKLIVVVIDRASQARVRSPWLDTYFLQTSMLGTHTFFLVFLPLFFFFGYDDLGRG